MGDGTKEKPKKPVDRLIVPAETVRFVLGGGVARPITTQRRSKMALISVATATAMLMATAAFGSADSLTLDGRQHEDRAARAFMDVDSKSYCVYLDKSQELDCVCDEGRGHNEGDEVVNDDDEGYTPFTLPSAANGNATVASLKLHQCHSTEMRMDLRPLDRPFYRMRVEDVENVRVDGITLLANDTVDVWFRNVNGSLRISGDVTCDDCDGGGGNATRPKLMVHIVDVGSVELDNLMVGGDVAVKIKVRNARSMRVRDSYFKSLPRDGLEVFNVAEGVSVRHSEFHDTTAGSALFNGVKRLDVRDSLLDREAVELLNEETAEVSWLCTLSPLQSPSEAMSPEELANCTLPTGRSFMREGDRGGGGGGGGGAEAGGAIALAVVSATLFIAAVAVLAVLHRSGKLEQYL